MYPIPACKLFKVPHRKVKLSTGALARGALRRTKTLFYCVPLALAYTQDALAGGLAPAYAALALDLGGYSVGPIRRLG